MSSQKHQIPQTTNSPSLQPSPLKEIVEEVDKPTNADNNAFHDSTDENQHSDTSSSIIDGEDDNEVGMDHAYQDETLKEERPKSNSPPGSPKQNKDAHKGPEITGPLANTKQPTAKTTIQNPKSLCPKNFSISYLSMFLTFKQYPFAP